MSIDKAKLRIIFFGTPDFAVASLKAIVSAGYQVVAVVTAPDKAAGRGYNLQSSAVKKAGLEMGLKVLQPEKLKSPEFIQELQNLKADIQIVIAFRMLPELVWNMPPMGTFNLHASYLPNYRGAAPINRAIMDGCKETGVSTFFLKHEIDTGSIILREKVAIGDNENAGSLHDRLMLTGADLVVKSLDTICQGNTELIEQEKGEFPIAPKIFTEDCEINWHQSAVKIHNMIRGLSPYPAAFTTFHNKKLKVFESEITDMISTQAGHIEILGKDQLLAHTNDRILLLKEVQYEGKKRMSVKDFINGFKP
ncbi:MAG TPA: methionyl-tRNA formyltransferase [Bacteroidia bacterium]